MPKKPMKRKPTRAKKVAPKPAKKAGTKKTAATKPAAPKLGKEIGRVVAFFRIPVVAVVKVTRGPLAVGDRIWIRGHTTKLKMTVASMQINHQPITTAKRGDEVGIQVPSRARRGDRVYQPPA